MRRTLSVDRSTPLSVSAAEAFAWHARPGALERLIPPWLRIEVPWDRLATFDTKSD